jgi:hypothetical protein
MPIEDHMKCSIDQDGMAQLALAPNLLANLLEARRINLLVLAQKRKLHLAYLERSIIHKLGAE